jgi:hypothetical protein
VEIRVMRTLPALLIALVILPATARAAWIPNGNPLCTAANAQSQISMCPDGTDGFFAAWLDARSGSSAVYVTRILGDGTIPAGWPADGMLVSSGGVDGRPFVVPDGEGGVVVVWITTGWTIRLQGVSPDGVVYYVPGGVTVIPFPNAVAPSLAVAPDGAGGAYVAWARRVDDTTSIASVTRIHSDGTFVAPFTANGVPVDTLTFFDVIQGLRLSRDASGGVAIAADWIYDGAIVHYLTLVGHVTPGASLAFRRTLYGGDTLSSDMVSDGMGGLFCGWSTYDRYFPTYPRLQSYGAEGQKEWPDTTRQGGSEASLLSDGGGGVYVVEVPTEQRIQARRLLADGSLAPGWPANGVVIAQNQNGGDPARLAPTSNGFLAVWADRNPDSNLHAAAWMSNGALAPGWPIGGANVSSATGNQEDAALLPSSTEGAFVAWEDSRNGNVDVYATRVEPVVAVSVPLPEVGKLAFRALAPNPARNFVRVDLTLGADGQAKLDLIDVRGRVCAHALVSASSTISLDGLATGLYWLRATRNGSTATARLAIVH